MASTELQRQALAYGIWMPPSYGGGDSGEEPTPTEEPSVDPLLGRTGHLRTSKLRFKVTAVEGDTVTIRYANSRQDWSGPRADLEANSVLDS